MTEDEPGLSRADADALLGDVFAPWVQDLNLSVETVSAQSAILRMPFDEKLCRIGGMICGQALLTGADTAMVIAICSALGGFKPFTTVDLTVNYMRPIANEDALLTAKIMRQGRTMVFCNTEITGSENGKLSAFSTGTYALVG
ncbi:MAG: PaaI family thioesterase [Rhizobiales bacterium]|nr:PaaI family thioesterase [Hyphomicrobiales bacterium]